MSLPPLHVKILQVVSADFLTYYICFLLESLAIASFTRKMYICHELHFYFNASFPFTNFTSSMSGKSAKAIAIPWDGSFPIVAYQSGQSGNYIWTLRNFQPETGAFESLYTSTNASAPAEDIASRTHSQYGASVPDGTRKSWNGTGRSMAATAQLSLSKSGRR